jgi:hypothetical protein
VDAFREKPWKAMNDIIVINTVIHFNVFMIII